MLKPQEIRNCVYYGSFNTLLAELNREDVWRIVLGSHELDSRMSDIELILRFFAFIDLPQRKEAKQQRINLMKYLNTYMGQNSLVSFPHCIRQQNNVARKINPVVFDAVCSAANIYGNESLPASSLSGGLMITLRTHLT